MTANDSVLLGLSHDEALVVFEWLAKNSERGTLENFAEDHISLAGLNALLCALESTLTEPLARDYDQRLSEARARLAGENS